MDNPTSDKLFFDQFIDEITQPENLEAVEQFNNGKKCYFGDEHGHIDLPKAREHFRIATELGVIQAMVNYGVMLLRYEGCDELTPEMKREAQRQAFHLFTKAHEEGNLNGTFNLGLMYFSGIGLAKNWDKAQQYFKHYVDHTTDNSEVKYYYAKTLFDTNPTEAIELMKQCTNKIEPCLDIADYYMSMNEQDKAVEFIDRAYVLSNKINNYSALNRFLMIWSFNQ
jgi:TPR repeat protein